MEYADFSNGFVVKLSPKEELHQMLVAFVRQKKIPSASYYGIGALQDIKLGYFDREKNDYRSRYFAECYELLSLHGNFSIVNGQTFPHTHVVLANSDYQTIGGHLFSATVAITVELFLFPIDIALLRKPHPNLNFKELDLPHHFSL